MKILVISDTHGGFQKKNYEPDLIFLLGDVDLEEIREIDRSFRCPKYGVLGNHDDFSYFIDTNVQNIHAKHIQARGYSFAGFGGCPRYNKRKYGQYTEEELQVFLNSLPKVDFFLSHSNPMWTPNDDLSDPHRGFYSYTPYIEEKQPLYFFHGHEHEEREKKIGNSHIISVYPYYFFEL